MLDQLNFLLKSHSFYLPPAFPSTLPSVSCFPLYGVADLWSGPDTDGHSLTSEVICADIKDVEDSERTDEFTRCVYACL